MKPVTKIILAVVGSIAALLIIAAVSLTTLIDPNDYKQEITKAVYDATGRELTFNGDMSLTFFPWFGVSLGEISITNPNGFPEEAFASVAQAKASVKVMPLFFREVEFSDVILKGLTLNLIENADGKNNWTFAPPKDAQHKTKRRGSIVESKPKAAQSESVALAALLIESLSVTDTNVTFESLRQKTKYSINDLSLTSSALRAGEPFTLKLSGIARSEKPEVEAPFQMTLDANPSMDFNTIDVTNIDVTMEPKGKDLPGKQASIHLNSALTAKLKDKTVSVHKGELSAYNTTVKLTGEAAYAHELDMKGHLTIEADYRKIAKALGISPPQPANDNSELLLSTQVKLVPDTFALNDIQGSLGGYPIDGDFQYYFGNKPQLRLRLNAEQIDLDPYIALAELLSKSSEHEKKTAKNKKQQPKRRVASPAIKGRTTNVERNAEKNIAKAVAPETLAKLNATVDIAIKKVVVKDLTVSNIIAKGTGKDGVITVNPLRFTVFEGDVNSTVKTDLRGTLPVTSIKLTTDKMNLANITTLLAGKQYASGKLFLNASLSAYGMTKETVSRTLNGKATFNATDGTITGLDALPKGSLDVLDGSLRKKIESSLTAQPYEVIRGTLFAKNGRVSNNDFIMKAAEMNAKGSGFANLASDSIHYKADVKFDNVPVIPVVISGRLSKPKYGIDMKRFLGSSVEDITKSLMDEENKDKNPLKQLEKGLKNLFK
ncbi:AsmA family protein [Halodesulfovibrio sp.]|uniref:AsmA family protein n=1 Tax=Halodesulfovibrio sp. TaxID=1912772 RepID=UPI0025C2D9F4|nr:AsmA family protein [Halodesulfovibrio sp.]